MDETVPRCWKCDYALTGLRIDDVCPECGTPIWSAAPGVAIEKCASDAQTWGILSVVLLFACLGPLAGFVAIPAIRNGRRAVELERTGRVPAVAIAGARTGLICGWITVAVSIAWLIVAAFIIGFGSV